MRFPGVLQWLVVYEAPNVAVKGAEFFLDLQKSFAVADGGLDLATIADDAGIFQQRGDFATVEARYFLWIKVGEELAVAIALF